MAAFPPSSAWALEHLYVADSYIAGRGLFAGDDVSPGEVMFRLGGTLVTTIQLDAMIHSANAAGRYVDCITVFEDRHLVLPDDTIIHFANHACDPNLWHDGPYDVVARRHIAAGDELTIDYGTNSGATPGFVMVCSCGSSACREEVTSEDWQRPELQVRYSGHWVPALAERIAHRSAR